MIFTETLAWLRQSAKVEGTTYAHVLLHVLERLDALEQRPIPGTVELAASTPEAAPVATDDALTRCYAEVVTALAKRGVNNDDMSKAGRRACYELGREHGGAQPPAPQPTPPDRLRQCPTHGQQPPNAWGCPQCVRELREELAKKAAQPAQPTPPAAPAGGLVERLASVFNYGRPLHPAARCAAIREVAAWLKEQHWAYKGSAAVLLHEADR